MEITFARETRYSVDVNGSDLIDLAKALNISVKKLRTLVADGGLDTEQKDDVARWLDERPMTHSIEDEGFIEDLEIHGE
jgi:hypothetical protein